MNDDHNIKNNSSLYPEQDLEELDDNSWQISYLDIITIVLGFLIILLSISNFVDYEFGSVSGLFKSSVEEAEYLSTPINLIEEELNLALLDEIDSNELKLEKDLNDLLIRFNSDDLYLTGSATLQTNALSTLDEVAEAIKNNKYNDFQIDVEGHTDDLPISSSAYPSNWELSTARATNVVKYLKGMGISPTRLKASGYGASRPLVPNLDADGNPIPENRAKNRRVVLRLYYTSNDSTGNSDQTKTAQSTKTFDDSCQYSVQLGGFESFSNALQKAKQAINRTSSEFNITFNGRLFSVRTKVVEQFSQILNQHRNITEVYSEQNIPIIHQCYDENNDVPNSLQYLIQIGVFQNQENAFALKSNLIENYQFSTEITLTSDSLYRVASTPIQGLDETMDKLNEVEQYIGSRAFITYAELNSSPYEFNFQIQIGTYSDNNIAAEISNKVLIESGLSSDIKFVEDVGFIVISEVSNNWNNILQSFDDLNDGTEEVNPIIYLLEYQ